GKSSAVTGKIFSSTMMNPCCWRKSALRWRSFIPMAPFILVFVRPGNNPCPEITVIRVFFSGKLRLFNTGFYCVYYLPGAGCSDLSLHLHCGLNPLRRTDYARRRQG